MTALDAIVTDKLSKRIDSHQILKNISLKLNFGERVLLVGANGAGKSTLLRVLSGLARSSSGTISYHGQKTCNTKEIGYIGHSAMIYATLTVVENLKFFAALYGVAYNQVDELIVKWNLSGQKDKYPAQLSKGQLARVSLARAFLNNPRYLFLDEPTSALDQASVDILLQQLEQLWQFHKGEMLVVITTHDLARLKNFAKRVIVLDEGQVLIDSLDKASSDNIVETTLTVYLEHNR
jgi:heme ABC exporter ATP-binding subunit CcmA